MPPHCESHGEFCEKLGSIQATLASFAKELAENNRSIREHIIEAEKPGGVRERVSNLEAALMVVNGEISTIKKGYWKACIVSALIGGLIARLGPDIIGDTLKYVVKIFVGA